MKDTVTAIVLAAGESKRLGRPKQLEPIDEETFLDRVIKNILAARVDEVLVVLGARAGEITEKVAYLNHPRVRTVVNAGYAAGMFTSIQAALRASADWSGAYLLALCDQPYVEPAVIEALIIAFRNTDCDIVIPEHDGRHGHPILFDSLYRDEILAEPAGGNLQEVLRRQAGDIWFVHMDSEAVVKDIDTDADLASIPEIPHTMRFSGLREAGSEIANLPWLGIDKPNPVPLDARAGTIGE